MSPALPRACTTLTTVPHDLVCLRLDLLVLGQVPSGPLQVFFLHRGTLLLDGGFGSANLGKPREPYNSGP